VHDTEAGSRRWWVLIAVGVGTFMSALDGSIVNTILPVIKQFFGATVGTVEWAVTVYLLVVSGLLLTFGRLGDLRGHKKVYVSGFGLFVLGSALCGLAPTAEALIAFRAFQALGAAMLFANSPAILTGNFPSRRRGQALGMAAMMTYLGLTIGPSLGGWLTVLLGWRSVFYINVPVGLFALLLSVRFIPADHVGHMERFDLPGALTFMGGLTALLFALNRGHARGWGSPLIVLLLAVSVGLLTLFLFVENRAKSPMLDLNLFKRRMFSAASAAAVLNYVCLYMVVFLMPFYLILGRGLNAGEAGVLMASQPLVMAVAAPLSGMLSDRIGSRIPGTAGMVVMAAGLLLLSTLGRQAPFGLAVTGLAIIGLGTGIFISPNSSALMGSAPPNRQGIASGILATARNVGMVLGVGLAGAIFTTILTREGAGGSQTALFTAIEASFRVAGAIAALAAVTSAVRGK
jgi:EmrB/QacA subfamily drug resistance transporter